MKRSAGVALLLLAFLFATTGTAGERKTVVLNIRGMYCSGCAEGITSMLKRVKGVTGSTVSYEARRARVEYDSAKTGTAAIITAVEKLGYKASLKK